MWVVGGTKDVDEALSTWVVCEVADEEGVVDVVGGWGHRRSEWDVIDVGHA